MTLLTLADCAERLAVSLRTVRRLVKAGTLAAIRVGPGKTAPFRVRPADLDAFIESRPAVHA